MFISCTIVSAAVTQTRDRTTAALTHVPSHDRSARARLASQGGKKVLRAYTPLDSGVGYVDFVIKVRDPQRFPEGEECNLSSAAAAEGSEPDGAVGRARMSAKQCVRHVDTLSLSPLV